MPNMPGSGKCELCSDQAVVYCHADVASLCWSCDFQVHSVNFLVKRHIRTLLCSICHAATSQLATTWSPTASSFCVECLSQKQDFRNHEEVPISSEAPKCSSQDSEHTAAVAIATPKQIKAGTKVPFCAATAPPKPLNPAFSATASEVSCSKQAREKGVKQDFKISTADHEVSSMHSDSTSPSQSWDRKRKRKEMGGCQNNVVPSCKEMRTILEVRKQTQLEPAVEAKLEAILFKWHNDLCMVQSGTVYLAMHLLQRALQIVGSSSTKSRITRVSLAVCLSLAAKLCEQKLSIPTPKQMERCTGVSQRLLQICEVQLCNLLGWIKMDEEWDESSP